MGNLSRLYAISVGFSVLYTAQAFNFSHNDPTSCDDLSLSWSGGTAPFYVTLIPVFGTPRNISIPSSSFSDGKGSYSTQLPFAQNDKFLVSMSDSTGYGTGGTSEILSAGASATGSSCNTTDPGVSFSFQLNSALQQCRAYTFSDYTGAEQPITIIGTIPGGDSFVLNPPNGPTSFDWNANVWNGTSLIFLMFDSQGRQGGSSDVKTVGLSDDSSCINGDSPSSTMSPSATSTSSQPSESSSSSRGTPIGAIAGTVIGALVFLAVFITLGLFFLRRRQDRNRPEHRVQRHSRRMRPDVDLLGPPADPYPYSPYSGDMTPAVPNTPATTQMLSTHDGSQHSNPFYTDADHSNSSFVSGQPLHISEHAVTDAPEISPFVAQSSGSSQYSSPAQRKAAMAGVSNYKPSRFIVHTDIEDTPSVPEEDEVIELPPQYSERRAPQSSGAGSHLAGSSTGGSTSTSGKGSQPL